MKTKILTTVLVLLSLGLFAQVSINTDGSSPDGSAMLDVKSSDKGMLVPRMSTAQRTAISSPATGLLVFDETTRGFWFFSGMSWLSLSDGTHIGNQIADADNDTKILVEESDDEDIIRFRMAGAEKWVMIANRFEPKNTGFSLFLGEGAGSNDDNTINENVGVGKQALRNNINGSQNVSVGANSMRNNTSGYGNTALGYYALDTANTGSLNTAIGFKATTSLDNLTNATAIGANASVSQSNSLVLGDNANVGIGTSAPGAKLEVVGDVKIDDGTQGAGKVLTSDANGLASWQSASSVIPTKIADTDNDTKVQVDEAGIDDDIIRFDMAGTEFFRMDSGRIEVLNTGRSVFLGDGAGANDDFSDNSNTAIGYNALNSNTDGYSNTASGDNALNGNVDGHSNTATGFHSLKANFTGAQNTAMGMYSNLWNQTGSNNTSLGYMAGVSLGTPNLTNATAIGANAVVSQDNSLVLGNAAKVGIGTSTPDAKLHVVGDVKIVDGNQGDGKVLTSNANGVASWQTATADNDWTVDADTLYSANGTLTIKGGKVGIGTSNPQRLLHIQSDQDDMTVGWVQNNTNAPSAMALFSTTSATSQGFFSAAPSDFLAFGQHLADRVALISDGQGSDLDAAGLDLIAMDDVADIRLYTGGMAVSNERMRITNNGNVGIGTSAPDAKLHIVGRTRIDGDRFEFVNTGGSVFVGYGAGANDDFSFNKNVAVGDSALLSNTTGSFNTASGYRALLSNTTGLDNTAIGYKAMYSNTTGHQNTASGYKVLYSNTTGISNTASGYQALYSNTTGSNNTALGYGADVSTGNLTNATAIGANAIVSQSNSLVLGNAVNVGIGTSAPNEKLEISGGNVAIDNGVTSRLKFVNGSTLLSEIGQYNTTGMFIANKQNGPIRFHTGLSNDTKMIIESTGNVGIGTSAPSHKLDVVGTAGLSTGTAWTNTSDMRLKENVRSYERGLDEILQINPIYYTYTEESGLKNPEEYGENIGISAQELQNIIPEAITVRAVTLKDGTVMEDALELTKADAMWFALINAVKEQQAIIEDLKASNEQLQTKVDDALK